MRKPLAAALAFASSLWLAPAPRAEAPANMLAEVGMLGRWARDCGQPAGGKNPHVTYERAQGGTGAQYRVDFGASGPTIRSVDNVRVVSEGTIAMRFTTLSGDAPGLAFDITMLKAPNRFRVIASTGSDGKVYIRNGIVVDSGAENPWQQKCTD